MRKITFPFILGLFFLIGCKEEEKPIGPPYGLYDVESVTTSIPVDFTNSGEQTTEHLANFSWCGTGKFSIEWRLNKQTPIMDFDTFMFWEWVNEKTKEKEILKGCGFSRRIVYLKENGELELKFFGGEEVISNNPERFLNQFVVKNLDYFPANRSIRMVTYQQLYDFFSEEFVESEITYLFKFAGPVFLLQ
jgi:hypothetical protein